MPKFSKIIVIGMISFSVFLLTSIITAFADTNTYYSGSGYLESKTLSSADGNGNIYYHYIDEDWSSQGYGRVDNVVFDTADSEGAIAQDYTYWTGTQVVSALNSYINADYTTDASNPVFLTKKRYVIYDSGANYTERRTYYNDGTNRIQSKTFASADGNGNVYYRYINENFASQGYGRTDRKVFASADAEGAIAQAYTYWGSTSVINTLTSYASANYSNYATPTFTTTIRYVIYDSGGNYTERRTYYSDGTNRIQSKTFASADGNGNVYYRYINENFASQGYGRTDRKVMSAADSYGATAYSYDYHTGSSVRSKIWGYANANYSNYSNPSFTTTLIYEERDTGDSMTLRNLYYNDGTNRIQSKTFATADGNGKVYYHYINENWASQGYGRVDVDQLGTANGNGEIAFEYSYHTGTNTVQYMDSYLDANRTQQYARYEYNSSGTLINTTSFYEYYSPSGLLKRKTEAATGDVYEYENDDSYYNNGSYGRPLVESSHTTTTIAGLYTTSSWYEDYDWGTQTVEIAKYDGVYSVSAGYSTQADVQTSEMRLKYVYMHNSHYTVATASSNWDMLAKGIYNTSGEADANLIEAYQWYSGNGYTPGNDDLMKSYSETNGTGTEWDNTTNHAVITSAVYTASSPLVAGIYTPNDYYYTYDWDTHDVVEKGYEGTYAVSSAYTTRTDVVGSELRVKKVYIHDDDYTVHHSTWQMESQLIYQTDGSTKDDYYEYYNDGSGSTPGHMKRAIDYGTDLSEWTSTYPVTLVNTVSTTRSYVDCGHDASLNITGAITLEAWINTTNNTSGGVRDFLFCKFDQGGNKDGYALAIVNNKLLFYSRGGGSGNWVVSGSTGTVNDGEWHHVAVTYSSQAGTYYIDGMTSGTFTTAADPGTNSTLDLHIGGTSRGGQNLGFDGTMRYAGVYSSALSADDIDTLYWGETIGNSPVSRWGFTEGSGSEVCDSTGNSDGTIVNTVTWGSNEHRKVVYASYSGNGTQTLYGSYTTDNSYNLYSWNYPEGVYTSGNYVDVEKFDGVYTVNAGDEIRSDIVDSELRVSYMYKHNGVYTNLDPSSNGWNKVAQTIYDPADGHSIDNFYEWYISGNGLKRSYDDATEQGTEWEDTSNHYVMGTATYTTTVLVSGMYTANESYTTYDWTYSSGIYTTGHVNHEMYDGEYSVEVGDVLGVDIDADERRVAYLYKHNGVYTNLNTGTNGWILKGKEVYDTDGTEVLELSEWYDDSATRRWYDEHQEQGTEWETTAQGHKIVTTASYTTTVIVSGLYTANTSYTTYWWNPTTGEYTTGYLEVGVYDGEYTTDMGSALQADVQDSEERVEYIYKHNADYTNLNTQTNNWDIVVKEILGTDGDTTLELYEYYESSGRLMRAYNAAAYSGTEWEDTANHYTLGTATYTTTVLVSGLYTANNSYTAYDWTYDTGEVLVEMHDGHYSVDTGDPVGHDIVDSELRVDYIYKHNGTYTNLNTGTNGWRMLQKGIYSTDGDTIIEGNWFYDNSNNRLYQKLEGEGSTDDAYQYFDDAQGIGGDSNYYGEIKWEGDYTITGYRSEYTTHAWGAAWIQYDSSYTTFAAWSIDEMKTFEYYSGSYSSQYEWINIYVWDNPNTEWDYSISYQHHTNGSYSTSTTRTTSDSFKPSDIPDKPVVSRSGGSSLVGEGAIIEDFVSDDALLSDEMKAFFNKIQDMQEGSAGGGGVLVALLDSGLNADSLKVNLLGGYDFAGKSRSDGLSDADFSDSTGHGTKTAEVLAAAAPDADVIVAKVLDDYGRTTSSIVANAIRYAVDMGARVLTMPFELGPISSVLDRAIDYAVDKGTILIAAAGNDGVEIKDTSLAAQNGIFTVGSVDNDGELSAWSNYGDELDLLAPWDIIENEEGTSYSAAFVAGIAALLLEEDPDMTSNELLSTLRSLMSRLDKKDDDKNEIKGEDEDEVLSMLDAIRENREGFTGYSIQEDTGVDTLEQ
ncbi:S8 family serine peptidase [Candidatus Omnitrophota bacterium]